MGDHLSRICRTLGSRLSTEKHRERRGDGEREGGREGGSEFLLICLNQPLLQQFALPQETMQGGVWTYGIRHHGYSIGLLNPAMKITQLQG